MLKFAARYLEGNSGSFGCADTAYILSYSVIMTSDADHVKPMFERISKKVLKTLKATLLEENG